MPPGPASAETALGSPLVERFGAFGETVFTTFSALAAQTGAINLGQGVPDGPGLPLAIEVAAGAMAQGRNQYPPLAGTPELLTAIAAHQRRFRGIELDPERAILVTVGATEAMAAAVTALCEPGDEVVVFEPCYDAYAPAVAMAQGVVRTVALEAPAYTFTDAALDAAISERTRLVVVNTPHNPTGRVFGRPELERIADRCRRHDLVCLVDEVYEHLIFEGAHLSMASLDAMAERTLSISSAAKTFSLTGWKIGWITGTPELISAVRTVKQYLTFAAGTPLQLGVAAALGTDDATYAAIADDLKVRRDLLCSGLRQLGLEVHLPAAGYFAMVDLTSVTDLDADTWCRALGREAGVIAIPGSAFAPSSGTHLARFAFCKGESVLAAALERLAAVDLSAIGR